VPLSIRFTPSGNATLIRGPNIGSVPNIKDYAVAAGYLKTVQAAGVSPPTVVIGGSLLLGTADLNESDIDAYIYGDDERYLAESNPELVRRILSAMRTASAQHLRIASGLPIHDSGLFPIDEPEKHRMMERNGVDGSLGTHAMTNSLYLEIKGEALGFLVFALPEELNARQPIPSQLQRRIYQIDVAQLRAEAADLKQNNRKRSN
jgi:hypothetical protein